MSGDALYKKIWPIRPRQAYKTYNTINRAQSVTYRANDMTVIATAHYDRSYQVEVLQKHQLCSRKISIGKITGDNAKKIFYMAQLYCR